MADLFTRTELNFGGAMAADQGLLTPDPTNGLSGVLMQNIQLTYAQNVTRIYEIGNAGETTSVYYVGGRSQGTMSVAHIIGPAVAMAAFYENFSDVCQAGNNTIQIAVQAQCDSTVGTSTLNANNGFAGIAAQILAGLGGAGNFGPQISYTAKYCVLTQVGMSVSAQDFVINTNSQLMFSNLEYEES